jgi:hypothetical protein
MPGIAVDIETQLLIDKVVKGSKLDASVDDLLEDINKKAKRKGISPIDEKTFMGNINVLEREFERINKKQIKGAGISGNTIEDAIKQYEKIEAAGEEIKKRFLKRNIELNESQAKALAKRILDYEDSVRQSLRKARTATEEADKKNIAKVTGDRQTQVQKGNWSSLGIDTMETGGKPTFGEIKMPKIPTPKEGGLFGGEAGLAAKLGALAAIALPLIVVGVALKAVMETMVKESKIVGLAMNTWNKAMGLLMDLILLPFIPILTWAIIGLFKAIVGFGQWWTGIWRTIQKEGLVGLIRLGIDAILKGVEKWIKNLLRWFFDDEISVGEKIANVLVALGTLLFGIFAWIGEKVVGAIIDFVFGQGTYEKAKTAVINFAIGIIDDIISFIYDVWFAGGKLFWTVDWVAVIDAFLKWMWDFVTNRGAAMEAAVKWVSNTIDGLITWLYEAWIGSKTYAYLFDIFGGYINDFVKWLKEVWDGGKVVGIIVNFILGAVDEFVRLVFGAKDRAISYVVNMSGQVEQHQLGGIVGGMAGEPRLIIAHGGEEVIPLGGKKGGSTIIQQAGQPSTTNNIFNFYGLTDSQLQDKIRSTLRQDATRYTQ